MEVLEENPLKIEIKSSELATNKNNVGRPSKKNEILFSSPPKSIISLLLREEKDLKVKVNQSKKNYVSKPSKEETVTLINKTAKLAKQWRCEYCSDRIFYKKNEHNEHLKSHIAYKCDYENCSYSSKFPSNLKIHKRIHKSDYLYVCDECTFRTKFINSLKTHKRLHSRELPYACEYCNYKCNSGSNLKKHCSRKHSNTTSNSDLVI